MIFSTSSALVLALATGFAAAKPIHPRAPEALPEYRNHPAKRNPDVFGNNFGNNGFNNDNVLIASSKETSVNINVDNNRNDFFGGNNNDFFDFGGAFGRFNNEQTVINVKEQNLQIVDNGIQQAVIQQAQEVLIVDQGRSRFNDLFRQSNYRRNFGQVSTVVMVVQQIQVAVDDGRGNIFQKDVFAQSAVIANRGRGVTQTVLVSDERVLIATQVLNDFGGRRFGGNGGFGGVGVAPSVATATAGVVAPQLVNGTEAVSSAEPTRTNNIALFDAKPTWSSIDADPAATLAAGMQAELQDNLNGNADDVNAEEDKVLEALKKFE